MISIMSKKSTFISIFLLMLPITGFTLGFGNLTVFSKLNEPLKIHINLVGSKSVSIDDLIVKNADIKTYKRANIPKPSAFNKVRFKLRKEANGSIVVELTTKKPVREPFFTFIADMKWRTGHLNREYTFLLDPPEFIHKNSYPKKQTKVITKKTSTSKASVSTLTPGTSRNVKQRKTDYSAVIASHIDGETYATKRADTLWDIAKKVKPDNNVTTHQTMQALFALNPDAFIKGNINLLKQGQILKIPSSNEVRQINGKPLLQKSAAASVKRSLTSSSTTKQTYSSRVIERPSDKIVTTESNIIKKDDVNEKAQLKILLPTEELLNNPVTNTDDLLLINKALQTSISTIKSLQSENHDLSKRITSLTDKLNKLDEHNQNLNIKISEISSLLKNKKNTTQIENSNSLSKIDNADSINTPLKIDSDLAPINQEKSFVRELLTNPVIIFSLVIFTLIILVSILFSIRNRNKKRKPNRQENNSKNLSQNIDTTSTTQEGKSNSTQHSRSVVNHSNSLQGTDISEEKDEDDMDFFEYFEKKINTPDEANSSKNSEPSQTSEPEETADITFDLDITSDDIQQYKNDMLHSEKNSQNTTLSEIDTYLAYGNYDKAEKLLTTEISRSPTNKNLHLKLFECYTFSNKRYEFIKHAENIVNLLNIDMVLRHRIESIFQQAWNETLDINNF